MSLRRRLLFGALAVAAVSVVVGLIGAGIVQREVRRTTQNEVFRQAEETAALIERAVLQRIEDAAASTRARTFTAQEVFAQVRRQVSTILEQTRLVGGHDYVEAATISRRGVIALTGDAALIPQLIPDLAGSDARQELFEVEVEDETVIASVRVLDFGERFPAAGEQRVSLAIAIGRTSDLAVVGVVTRIVLAALAVGGIGAALLAFGLSRRLGRRLDAVATTAAAYAAGDFEARVPVSGHGDELAAVGHAFNDMAAGLAAARVRERDFLMSIGHDLRTPLTTIRGYAEALDTGDVVAHDLPRVAGVIHAQTDRLSRLVEDVMALARLQARQFTLREEAVDVRAHIKEVVEGASVRADAAGVRIRRHLEEVGIFRLDPDRLAQMTGNLLDNALRYTPDGGVVTVTLAGRDGGFELAVADTGPGIDPEDLPRVFERLFVAQRYRPVRREGTGLGLAIVKELVEAMGATVAVRSELGKGTEVVVVFGRSGPAEIR